MHTPKLLKKQGQVVREWMLSTEDVRLLMLKNTPERLKEKLDIKALKLPQAKLMLIPDKIDLAHLLNPQLLWCRIYCPPRYRVRKNQKNLTPVEWLRFITAIEALASDGMPSPTYDDFVNIHMAAMDTHAGHAWGAHTMGGHNGRNFLTWHREYLAKLEARLILINPLVTIPYWDWVHDRFIPPQLSNPSDIAEWGITRNAIFNGAALPSAATINGVLNSGVIPPDFLAFSTALEGPHGNVHNLVGGTMATSASPADPIFWLHHAFIDKLWADWQIAHPGAAFNPPNMPEILLPAPIMTRTVAQIISTTALGYVYA